MTTEPIAIATNHVYINAAGEQRLVVEVSNSLAARWYISRRGRQPDPVVNWRTADPKLPQGAKAQGSATLRSFQRWAVSCRKATSEDWEAFATVQRQRSLHAETKRMVREIRKQQGTWPPAKW